MNPGFFFMNLGEECLYFNEKRILKIYILLNLEKGAVLYYFKEINYTKKKLNKKKLY